MLENLYTTKMSTDKNKLQKRFLKINSKSSKTAKLAGTVMFVLVLTAVVLLSGCLALTQNSYSFKEKDKDYQTEESIIEKALAEGEEILANSGMAWNVNAPKVREIINSLSEIMNMKMLDVKDGNYKVMIYATELEGNGAERIYIINTDTSKLLFTVRLDWTKYAELKEYYGKMINILEEMDKEFEMSDLKGMTDVTLTVGSYRYPLTSYDDMSKLEKMLSSAKPVKGATKCPFDAALVILNSNKEKCKIELATDSCAVFRSGDNYYDYRNWDNSELYELFGLSADDVWNLILSMCD